MNASTAFEVLVSELEERIYQRVMKEVSNMQPKDEWLSMSEAAEFLGISPELVQRLCKRKVLPHVPVGVPGSRKPRILISQLSLSNYLRERAQESVRNYEQAQ